MLPFWDMNNSAAALLIELETREVFVKGITVTSDDVKFLFVSVNQMRM